MRLRIARTAAFGLVLLVVAAITSSIGHSQSAGTLDELRQSFVTPPADARIMMRWWWFGPAVTKTQIERELQTMREGGIGGVEVQPVYPISLDDPARGIKTLPFLSDEFIDHLRFAASKARELGLRMDLTVGSGWPYGGPQVGIEQAASKLRVERTAVPPSGRVPVPSVGAGEQLIATFVAPDRSKIADAIEVSDIRDGVVQFPAGAPGSREALFFIASRTGMMVKRPAVGAEGFVLSHYDRAALDGYLKNVGDRLLQAFGSQPPYAVFCDSLEVYESDWTPDFLEQFRTRRGYDLKPHLPALAVEGPTTAALRHDWAQTLTELLNERFVSPMQEWAHRNQTRFRLQGYGTPPAMLSTNSRVDLPEGEGAQWKTLSATRWASSASHIYARPVTSSETWTWLHSPVFRATPLDMTSKWVNQFSAGFSRLGVPIFNATIDGQYPIKAGLRGLPAGEADSSFPEIAFAGANAPTQWRGTDARAFTEYLNNYTLQNNLNWTHGKNAMSPDWQQSCPLFVESCIQHR